MNISNVARTSTRLGQQISGHQMWNALWPRPKPRAAPTMKPLRRRDGFGLMHCMVRTVWTSPSSHSRTFRDVRSQGGHTTGAPNCAADAHDSRPRVTPFTMRIDISAHKYEPMNKSGTAHAYLRRANVWASPIAATNCLGSITARAIGIGNIRGTQHKVHGRVNGRGCMPTAIK
jgi:hypothetical protein